MKLRWPLASALVAAALLAEAAPAASCPPDPDGHEPPCAPGLGSAVWSTPHRGPYAQDSSPLPGPSPAAPVKVIHRLVPIQVPVIAQITEPYPDGGRAIWFSTVGAPERAAVWKVDAATLRTLGSYDVTADEQRLPAPQTDTSGVYNVLTSRGHLVTVRGATLEVYGDAVPGVRASDVALVRRFALPRERLCRVDDRIIGITLTYAGDVAFATVNGVVGVLPSDPSEMDDEHLITASINGGRCADPQAALETVSNSLAADEDGAIYPLSVEAQYRFDLVGGELVQRWRTPYETGGGEAGARLDAGSGSTPTLMGTAPGDDRFVVITDGASLMNLVFMRREDGAVACKVPIDFGDPAATGSQSEQSVVVRGYGAAVVNNALALDPLFVLLPPERRPLSMLTAQVPGNAPRGVQRVDWDPASATCATRWSNPSASIPNSVPAMSAATNLLYGIGLRGGLWGLLGLDWDTGEEQLWVPSGPLLSHNSFFAQTTIGPAGDVIVGGVSGMTRFVGSPPG